MNEDQRRSTTTPLPHVAPSDAWWNLHQASAWIALRDAEAVGRARDGRDGRGVIGWYVEWAWRNAEGQTVGPSPNLADELLVKAARSGAIRTRGSRGRSNEIQEVTNLDWSYVTISDDPKSPKQRVLVPDGTDGTFWTKVRVHRDDLLREWPPLESAQGAAPSAPEQDSQPAPLFEDAIVRDKGGRRESPRWVLFDQEMARQFSLDGQQMTMRELKKRMKVWAAKNMEHPFDDRTIEKRLSDRAPRDQLLPD